MHAWLCVEGSDSLTSLTGLTFPIISECWQVFQEVVVLSFKSCHSLLHQRKFAIMSVTNLIYNLSSFFHNFPFLFLSLFFSQYFITVTQFLFWIIGLLDLFLLSYFSKSFKLLQGSGLFIYKGLLFLSFESIAKAYPYSFLIFYLCVRLWGDLKHLSNLWWT